MDSDAVTFVINARQVNTVKDLVPLDNLLVMTTGGEYKVTGGQDDVVTPSTIGVKNQGNAGSGDVQSKVIGDSAIFIQEEGQKIRDLRYQFEKDGFRGNDLSVWADHLFAGYEVKGIEYWKAPWQVVWFTRDDGVLVGCTYMPEQEVVGWHWHDTDGQFLDACALPGKKESECYFLVERVIDGETVQCIEQLAPTRSMPRSIASSGSLRVDAHSSARSAARGFAAMAWAWASVAGTILARITWHPHRPGRWKKRRAW